MSSFSGRLTTLGVGVFALLMSGACAVYAQDWRGGPSSSTARAHFERGYRDGLRAGETDARRGERFNFTDERNWQRARGDYAFREGFERGYAEGYRRRGGYVGDRGRGGYGGTYANPAAARGFEDGYKRGYDDGRDGDRYNPIGERDYRDGDNGYDRRFGTREQWKIAYREGFRAGYDRGYREARYR